jgi:pseudoazurin
MEILVIMTLMKMLAFTLMLGLVGCGENEAPAVNESVPSNVENASEEAVDILIGAEANNDEVEEIIEEVLISTNVPPKAAVESLEPVVVVEQSVEESVIDLPKPVEPRQLTVLAGETKFGPKVLFANPGDKICWANMTIHDSQSIEGLIPEGAEPWHIALGRNGCVTLTVEGVYIYKCNPHYPVGMAGAIIVGKANNIAQIEANVTGRAKGVVIKVKRALEQ